jgi:cell division protein FtsN
MERNRVLWVIFSISLFLVVVLAGGLYLLRPAAGSDAEVATGQTSPLRGFDAFEYVRGKSELPAVKEEPEEAEETVIIVGEREEEATEKPGAAVGPPEKAVPPTSDSKARGTAPSATAPTAAVTRPAGSSQPQPAARAPAARAPAASTPAARAPVARAPAARAPVARAPVARAPAVKPAPQPREVTVSEYWIQAGSYTSSSRAQEIASVLEEQGLVSKITTRALSGKTYYRVRIGPYMSKEEAQKFLEWVKAVKGFESSYISMVYAKRRDP